MAGFADGFRSGFGLISDVKDRELKRDQVEAEATYRKREADDLAAYRKEDLRIKDAAQTSAAGLDALRLRTAQTQAETASISAKTAQKKAEDATDPTTPEYKKIMSEIAENEAQEANFKSQADERTQKLSMDQGALNVQEIANYTAQSDIQGLGPEELRRISALIDENSSQSSFNLGYLTSPQTARSMAAIQTFMGDMSSGSNPEMTPELRAAFGGALGLTKSAAIGREIDESFVNAPDWMKGKNLRISGQGLHEVGTSDGKDLSGTLYVLAEDADGNVYPYFPPLTAKRNFANNQPLDLEMGEAVQALAGTAHMIQQIGPKLGRDVRAAKIHTMYGGNKDFDAAVNAKLETIRKGIQSGATPTQSALYGTEPSTANATVSEKLSMTKTDEYRRAVEHDMLFGPTDDTSEQFKIQEWFESTSSALAGAPVPKGVDAANLGELMNRSNASFNYQNASILQGYYNEDGEIEDSAGLIEQLKLLNLLK
jgi:hypothetical protein